MLKCCVFSALTYPGIIALVITFLAHLLLNSRTDQKMTAMKYIHCLVFAMLVFPHSAYGYLFILVLNREIDHDNLPGIYPAE